jgi:rhamnulose-1-phosphate aldolase/alcohol dehydrogenase
VDPVLTPTRDIEALIARSHALGADPRVTNYGGGNTSVKLQAEDPVTGEPLTLLAIKGSGGDLGTLQRDGIALLQLDRIIALKRRYRGVAHEDEMFRLIEEQCGFGPPGAAPSIDTATHALIPEAHVDHVHPDAIIAIAAACDGERLTRECFGDDVAWIPWQRPGFELALMMERAYRPGLHGMVLGGHGLSSWGATSDECERTTLGLIKRAEDFISARGRSSHDRSAGSGPAHSPFGALIADRAPLPPDDRRRIAADLAPVTRGLCSTDRHVVGHFDDSDAVLDFLAREKAEALSRLGTSCPDHFLRTKVRPLFLDLPPSAPRDVIIARLRELHREYRDEYAAYYARHAGATSPAMRGADPAIVLLPGVGMFSFGADAQTARVAGEFYVNAINVMRGAETLSSYEPIDEREKFRVEYWALEEAKLRRRPKPRALAGKVALITGAGSGIGRAIAERFAAEGAAVVVTDIAAARAESVAAELGAAQGARDRAVAVHADVSDEAAVDRAFAEACVAYGGVDIVVNNAGISHSAPLVDTTADDWDRQHRIMARGSFLVSRAAARVMIEQGRGGDIVYIVSKNAVFAGPNNVAYGAAKADQAHQVRLLAAELGEHRIRVNGVNPDAVVRGSGIFAGDWGDQRAAVYGVPREDLGKFYAERTLLKQEVMPEHVAAAVFALVGGDLPLTTGAIIPVDGGVPAAFLR